MTHVRLRSLWAGAIALALCAPAMAGPINTNAALTPRKGGAIFRLQYHYSEAGEAGNIMHVNSSRVIGTLVYGITEDLAAIFSAPYVNRQVDRVVPRFGRSEQAHDGVGDLNFMLKYRFWQRDDGPGRTMRWAVLGGMNFRSGNSDFSSDSYDPVIGTVFSVRRTGLHFDADLLYQFNTGRGRFSHDALRYDASLALRLISGTTQRDIAWELNAVAELNGRYVANGSHEVFLSPGVQFVTDQLVLETSIQLPVIQDLPTSQPETDYRVITGLRFQW